MANNYLEQLVTEWYEYQGYFVRRNVLVGKRVMGGYECELDVVGLHPGKSHLVHIEPSMDCYKWEKREQRLTKKFKAGRKYVPALFQGFKVPKKIEQIALFVYGSNVNRKTVGGGQVMTIRELIAQIATTLLGKRLAKDAIPEHMPILRTFQFTTEYRTALLSAWGVT